MSKETTLNIINALFNKKEDIAILGKAVQTNTNAGNGIGYSSSRPSGTKTPAKFSGAAIVLDKLLLGRAIAVRKFIDGIYGEANIDGVIYRFVCDENNIRYEKSALEGYAAMIPLVLLALTKSEDYEELADAFIDIKRQIKSSGVANKEDVAKFCDSFYYSVVVNESLDSIVVVENSLTMPQLQHGYNSGYLEMPSIIQDIDTPAVTGYKEISKEPEPEAASVVTEFDEIKKGASQLRYEWNESQIPNIPALETLEDFIPSPEFYATLRKITVRANKVIQRMDAGKTGVAAIGKDYVNFFVTGKPGTGKTTMGYALGAALRMPVYSIPMTKNTEEDTFQGVTKVVDGKLQFISTDFLKAYTEGGIIILEEINLPDPAVIMGGIGQAIEFPFILQKNGYETVHRHPLCIIIGTMNIGTYGSKGVNQALSSRFKQTYTLDDPEKNDFINILAKSTGATKNLATWVYDAYDALCSALKGRDYNAEDICLNITLRGCIGAIENIQEGENPKEAIQNTLVGKIGEVDLEIARRINEEVVDNLREYRGVINDD